MEKCSRTGACISSTPISPWAIWSRSWAMRAKLISRARSSIPMLKSFILAAVGLALMGAGAPPEYTIQAIRYGVSPGIPVGALVVGGPKDEKVDVDFVVWLIRGDGRNILFDSGFHHEQY